MTNRTAIVSGAAGCVGRAVCIALMADTRSNWTVYGLGRNATSGVRFPAGVLNGHGAHLHEGYVDAFFHCAGNTRYDGRGQKEQWDDNVKFTSSVVRWLNSLHAETKLIHTSTAASYLFHNERQTSNFYALSKAAAEWVVVSHPRAVILQPCVILGPGDTRNYSLLFNLASKGKLTTSFSGSIEFGYVRDIADAHLNAFYNGRGGMSYMLGGVHASWTEFFQTINDVVGSGVTVREYGRLTAKASVKAGEWWSWLRGKKPRIDSGTLNLLMRHAKVPTLEALRSRDEIGYTASRNLRDMCWLTWQWLKHDLTPDLSQVGVASPEESGQVVAKV